MYCSNVDTRKYKSIHFTNTMVTFYPNMSSIVDPRMKIWFNEIDSAFKICNFEIFENQIIEFLAYCTL